MNCKKTFLSIGFLGLLVLTVTANATSWRMVKDFPESKFFIDTKSVRIEGEGKKEGDKRKVHTLIGYKTLQRNLQGKQFFSMSFVSIYSCAKRTKTILSSVQYEGENGAGKIVNSYKMTVLIPLEVGVGTLDEYVMEMFVCDIGA